ncbi:hypothetical protein AV530_015592 [Patagioenas fasciata monilis]|uniref:Uncharacterized protein n=1 Tax=Patagioenas fasciata monilis TaxID=372326 RepID=A0A1V4KIA4_PATFA|nr:hypothetical protein AV530_015592 [Patagioenas fasciata monilis]
MQLKTCRCRSAEGQDPETETVHLSWARATRGNFKSRTEKEDRTTFLATKYLMSPEADLQQFFLSINKLVGAPDSQLCHNQV